MKPHSYATGLNPLESEEKPIRFGSCARSGFSLISFIVYFYSLTLRPHLWELIMTLTAQKFFKSMLFNEKKQIYITAVGTVRDVLVFCKLD